MTAVRIGWLKDRISINFRWTGVFSIGAGDALKSSGRPRFYRQIQKASAAISAPTNIDSGMETVSVQGSSPNGPRGGIGGGMVGADLLRLRIGAVSPDATGIVPCDI